MNKLLNILLITAFSVVGMTVGYGQQLPLSNQYLVNPFSISPSFAGHNQNYEAFIDYRQNWASIDGAANTKIINVNGIS